MSKQQPGLFGAIHLGSEVLSLQIVEYHNLEDIRVIETAARQTAMGEETFKNGTVSFYTVSVVCEVLKGYRRLCTEYGVRDIKVIATTAIREAENQEYIIDQIKVKTGLEVEVIDMPMEIFYKYIALYYGLRGGCYLQNQDVDLFGECSKMDEKIGTLFVDISSGGLGITLLKSGEIRYQQNLHMGVLRIKESFEKAQRDSSHFQQALTEYIHSMIEPVEIELRRYKIRCLILSGTETRMLLEMLGRSQTAGAAAIPVGEFNQLYSRVKGMNLGQLMKAYGLSESRAELVLPMIILYKQILSLTKTGSIIIPAEQFIDGMVIRHIAMKTKHPLLAEIEQQIVGLARMIGEKYRYDAGHSAAVEKVALMLFDRLARLHGLSKRERLLLQMATILHDIGKFVSLRTHYFYSYRLIISSDIMGFSEQEKAVIANVANYHSKGTPSSNDSNWRILSLEHRIIAAKLVAIIRVADAVDRTHRQKAKVRDIVLKGDELIVEVDSREDLSLEEWTFADKTKFFAKVFGLRPILKR